jgi:signal transduction histidine kinase
MTAADVAHQRPCEEGSTGVGLGVVRRTAEQAGGQLTVRHSRAGGARVAMSFPATLPNLSHALVRR